MFQSMSRWLSAYLLQLLVRAMQLVEHPHTLYELQPNPFNIVLMTSQWFCLVLKGGVTRRQLSQRHELQCCNLLSTWSPNTSWYWDRRFKRTCQGSNITPLQIQS
jgi:hypothetical protein